MYIVFSSSFPSFPLLNNLVHKSWDHYVRPSKTGLGVVECEGCRRAGPPRVQDVRILGEQQDNGDRGSDMQPGGKCQKPSRWGGHQHEGQPDAQWPLSGTWSLSRVRRASVGRGTAAVWEVVCTHTGDETNKYAEDNGNQFSHCLDRY